MRNDANISGVSINIVAGARWAMLHGYGAAAGSTLRGGSSARDAAARRRRLLRTNEPRRKSRRRPHRRQRNVADEHDIEHTNPRIRPDKQKCNAKYNMDALEIANILATELWCHQQLALDGLHSGVPTRTTSTLTPTHLRNIEQTFIDLQCRSEGSAAPHAGFVPPPIATQPNNYGILNSGGYEMGGGTVLPLHVSPGPGSSGDSSSSLPSQPAPKRRNMGGRRPAKAPADCSPEEEERRRIRRERNKMAAARCRKRRLDHTNELLDETAGLERKKQALTDEIRELNDNCKQLQYLLDNHLAHCTRMNGAHRSVTPPDVKPFQLAPPPHPALRTDLPPVSSCDLTASVAVKVETEPLDADIFTSPQSRQRTMFSANTMPVTLVDTGVLHTPPAPRARPTFLHVPTSFAFTPAQMHALKVGGDAHELAGIDISTPSSSLPFNFESLMDGGTGLTPVQPCATQNKITVTGPEILSPDTASTNKLMTDFTIHANFEHRPAANFVDGAPRTIVTQFLF